MNIEKDKRYFFAVFLVVLWTALTVYAMTSNTEVPSIYQNSISGTIGALLGSAFQKSKGAI